GLVAYPIFFFCDEAIQTNLADSLLHHGLTDENGVFLPPFFRNVDKWNLSLSVYMQGIGLMLFGKSVFVNRATSVVVSMLGVIAVALTLRLIFRARLWWAGALAMSALPVWFLHSRTSFETVMMVSFFACFLCSYLMYRYYDRRYLVAAIACGAATFYSYSNGQGVMLVSTVLLVLSDARYHLETLAGLHRRPRLLAALVAITILAIGPYLRQRALYPFSTSDHLIAMNSIVTRNIPLGEKLGLFWKEYLTGLSPLYWFAPDNGIDLERHTMKGWGNLPRVFFPFVLVGLWTCVRQWRSPAHRAVLIAILAAPFAAALVFIHNYRALAMVVPAAILTGLGIERIGAWLAGFVRAVPVALATAVLLVAMNGVLL
ncbi:MAG TPA: hypothetical protein VFT99_04940, partial [Roseiflexaceae bacterium]|nr:hypothetical protein [Roseiflexaceae bacterium]